MALVTLVRHGEAAHGWGDAADPGLSERGRQQAEEVAQALGGRMRTSLTSPMTLVTSPMRRCRETAAPLAARWAMEPRIEPRVSEIPSPPAIGLRERSAWLRGVLDGRWSSLSADLRVWREGVLAAMAEAAAHGDAVVFTHHVAINAALSFAGGDDRVRIARPDNCSSTIFEVVGHKLVLVALGREADTQVR